MINTLRITFSLLIVALVIQACNNQRIKEEPTDWYYDVQSLLKSQTEQLEELKPVVKKTIEIDGVKESHELVFNKKEWQNELDIFNLADINKPVLKDQYEAVKRSMANGAELIYRPVNQEAQGIVQLRLVMDPQEVVKKLEANYVEKNYLYSSQKVLTLEFDNVEGSPVLKSYKVSGTQKMIMKNQVDFLITSNIQFN
jgi:hypothetical protein